MRNQSKDQRLAILRLWTQAYHEGATRLCVAPFYCVTLLREALVYFQGYTVKGCKAWGEGGAANPVVWPVYIC